jgi:hypothetical protein
MYEDQLPGDRAIIDPDGRYPSLGLRHVERLALQVLRLLPSNTTPSDEGITLERTRDVIEIHSGGDEGIVIIVTPEAVELRLPTVEWTMGAYDPVASSRLWKRVKADGLEDEKLGQLLGEAQEARGRQFTKCRYCGERVAPEHRYSRNVCQGCSSSQLGVVY